MARILMVTPILKSQRGNSITATRLFNGLSRQGWDLDLLALDEPNWQVHLDRLIQSNTYSLVHAFHALQSLPAVNHPAINDLPLLLTATGTDINYDLTGPQREQIQVIIMKASRVVVFNDDQGGKLITAAPHLQSRLQVIPQGVDLPEAAPVTRKQFGLSENDTIFVIPSGLRPVKNLDLALDGLQIAQRIHPAMSLLILGSAIDADYTEHINSRLSHLSWVQYLGELPHGKVGGILQAADIVLNTSWAEGQPQGALEAMSLGKPCILSAVPGNLGIIKDGVQGHYITSAQELAEKALQLVREPAVRIAMGSAASQLVNERYSVESEIKAYNHLYKALHDIV